MTDTTLADAVSPAPETPAPEVLGIELRPGLPAEVIDGHLQSAVRGSDICNRIKAYYLEELDVTEIARVLHIPTGTVKSRLHHARAEFKRQWQAAHETAPSEAPALQKGETP